MDKLKHLGDLKKGRSYVYFADSSDYLDAYENIVIPAIEKGRHVKIFSVKNPKQIFEDYLKEENLEKTELIWMVENDRIVFDVPQEPIYGCINARVETITDAIVDKPADLIVLEGFNVLANLVPDGFRQRYSMLQRIAEKNSLTDSIFLMSLNENALSKKEKALIEEIMWPLEL